MKNKKIKLTALITSLALFTAMASGCVTASTVTEDDLSGTATENEAGTVTENEAGTVTENEAGTVTENEAGTVNGADGQPDSDITDTDAPVNDIPEAAGESQEIPVPSVEFATQTVTGKAEEADAVITLSGDSATVSGANAEAVTVNGSTVTVTAQGSYLISGTLTDGQLIVDTQDEKKVELLFNGVSISNSASCAVYVISAPKKAVINLCEGSVNILSDAQVYAVDEAAEDQPSATVYSKDDLKITGSGALYVTGNYNKGIFSKDDLEIESGNIYVSAVDDAIRGKDSVEILGGYLNLTAGGDGLRTSNETDEGKGYILIEDGEIYINAELDGIQAVTDLTVNGGTVVIESGGGSANASFSSGKVNEGWGQWGRGDKGGMGGMGGSSDMQALSGTFGTESTSQAEDTSSAKGIKAAGAMTITGGTFSIDSSDDAIHTNGTLTVNGGSFYILSGDDGIHADTSLIIDNATINIVKSYEGIESTSITVNGGNITLTASDDGFNAAGGNDGSAVSGRPGQNMFSGSNGTLTINGGTITVNASGDGLDSNGSVSMSGGYVCVYGPTDNGNGALDYDSSFTLTGGTLLAVGSSGMAQSVSASGQGTLAFTLSGAAETLLNIADSDGNSVLTFKAPKAYSCIVFTSPALISGKSYTVSTGGACTGEEVNGVYSGGTYSGGNVLGTIEAS